MDNVEVMIDNVVKNVLGMYYISNNNYYFLYTENQRDEKGYIVLHVVKVLQEVMNTPSGQTPTGNLVGIAINDEQEWKNVQKDISNIIADKQNKKRQAVRYLEIKLLKKLIVKNTRIFRLKEEIFNKSFNPSGNDDLILDYKNSYYEEVEKNRRLENEIKELKEKLNQLKNIIG